jgi:signal-transduction protein with cAMP-binding, CBS, and nucleotidyltransferase domain
MADVDKVADECRAKALASSTFAMLTESERDALMLDCEMHTYLPRKNIITQGEVNTSLYIISKGKANVLVDGNVGKNLILLLLLLHGGGHFIILF